MKVMKRLGAVGGVAAVGLAGMGYGLYSGNEYLFSPSLKFACWASGLATNIHITFDEAHGSIRDGNIRVRDAKVTRKGSKSKDFEFGIKSVDFIYSKSFIELWRDIRSQASDIPIEKLTVKGVLGTIDIKGESKTVIPEFCIKNLNVENVQVTVYDHTRKGLNNESYKLPALAIYRMTGYDLHSRSLLRDALVSSSLLGTIGPGVVSLDNDGSTISVRMQNIPVGAINKYVGEPFNWFTQAVIDVKAIDNFSERNHNMKLDILLRELVPTESEISDGPHKYIVPLLSSYLKKHESQIPVQFDLKLHEDEITIAKISKQISAQLAARVVAEGVNKIGKGWEDFKQLVNHTVSH